MVQEGEDLFTSLSLIEISATPETSKSHPQNTSIILRKAKYIDEGKNLYRLILQECSPNLQHDALPHSVAHELDLMD